MKRTFFKSSNKSQASLDKILDPRDHNPGLRDQHTSHQAAQLARQQQLQQLSQQQPVQQSQRPVVDSREGEVIAASPYPQSQQGQYTGPPYQHPQSLAPSSQQQQQQYTIQSTQQAPPQDERYYSDQPPSQVLNRSTSHRQSLAPVNAYQEQQQLQAQAQAQGQRPTISLVNPHQQQEDIPEDDHHQPGQTQFGRSQRLNTVGPKEEKKQRNSTLRNFFGGNKEKDKHRESQIDTSKPGRSSSILRKGQSVPQSPGLVQPGSKDQHKFPQSPQSQSSAAYQTQQFQHDTSPIEDPNTGEDPRQYYRPNSQYEPPSHQEGRRPSIQYHEDAPHFPTEQSQQYHESGLQQQQQPPPPSFYHQTTNVSQSQLERVSIEERKGEYTPYSSTAIRDRPSAVIEADHTLRPPSQSSLGPPSPLGGPATLATRQPSTNASRYSTQSVQAYQAAQQEANKIQQQQSSSQSQYIYPSPTQAQSQQSSVPLQGETSPTPTPETEMPSRGEKDRQQRESRVDEQDQRYQAQDPRLRMSTAQHETGRSTPPPRGREDVQQMDHQTLLQRYEELQAKYSKVKRYYFDREAQITQLQNTVANQRLSMSKTSLDDAQYVTRFDRLNGAIQNLSFNIRKDWRKLPNWLAPACNKDACVTGTKEMTAVGRAVIARWLFDNIFQTIFHPGIDQTLSQNLKYMEQTLRQTPSSVLTDEQRDDLLTKVTTWRLTTCEGLSDLLNSRQSEAHVEFLSQELTDQLCDYLRTFLNDPAPPNLDGYLLPIISQALSISANLPQESRDICIAYYSPGMMFDETYMKLETGMTPLEDPGSAATREDYEDDVEEEHKSVAPDPDAANVEEQIKEQTMRASAHNSANNGGALHSKDSKRSKGSGWFNGGLVKQKNSISQPPKIDDKQNLSGPKQDEHAWTLDVMTRGQKQGKIRLAVFLAVEVRGKSPKSADASQGSGAGNGSGDNKSAQGSGSGASAGAGVLGTNSGGTSGSVGTGGVNVLFKAPVFGF